MRQLKQPTETQEQRALFKWIRLQPKIKDIAYSIPNGAVLAGNSSKRAIQMNMLKGTGLLQGCPDICVPLPVGAHGALYIELKVKSGGKVSDNQENALNALSQAGNKAVVCHGCDEAIKAIEDYLCQK
jgi:hypothetical protein